VASGISSVICGGGWNNGFVTSTASGNNAFIGAGYSNTASSVYATVLNGQFQNVSSSQGFIGNGSGCTVNAAFASVLNGDTNIASGSYSSVLGGSYGTTRSIVGYQVNAASNQPITNATGVSQTGLLVLAAQTTDATATALRSNTSAAGTTNQVILPNNSAYLFKATVISNVTGGGNTSAWKLEGAIKRGANAASTTIVGLVTTTLLAQDAGAATWAIAATADTTNGGLRITFTGQASTTIRTVCKVETTEVTF
jgi:hypothetical protein